MLISTNPPWIPGIWSLAPTSTMARLRLQRAATESSTTCHMSHIMCHISRVICPMSHVKCHVVFFVLFFQSAGARQWSVCYQLGLTRLVFVNVC